MLQRMSCLLSSCAKATPVDADPLSGEGKAQQQVSTVMSSATDVQHFVDSASKDSVRPAASNTGMSAQNSGSWMLDLVSQHLKFKPAQAGKETQQHQLQGEKSAHTPGGVPSAVPTSQATVQPMQGAMALPAQGPPKKK